MAGRQVVYVGTHTGGTSAGIYQYELVESTGALELIGLAAEAESPSFLDLEARGTHLYAIEEDAGVDGTPGGAVNAYGIDPTDGSLTLLNRQPSGGSGACHINLDPAGRAVFVANYGSGSVAMLPIEENGHVGAPSSIVQHRGSSVNPERQEGPHAHSITPSLGGRFVFSADLGTDEVLIYKVDYTEGLLVATDPPSATIQAGAGPRHFAFHPTGEYAYVINELDSTVNAFACDGVSGRLSEIQSISTLPAGFDGTNYPADIHCSADGRFVYGTNRGHNSMAVFEVAAETGLLAPLGHESTGGDFPRNFGIDLTGRWLLVANQNTNNIVTLAIDPESGGLTPAGPVTHVGAPMCVRFLRLGA